MAGIPVEDDKLSSFMWDHRVDKHQGDMDIDPDMDFKWEILSSHRDPLSRQVTEAVRILQAVETNRQTDNRGIELSVNSLNRKTEIFAPRDRIVTF